MIARFAAWAAGKAAGLVLPGWLPLAAAAVAAVAIGGGVLYIKSLRSEVAALEATVALRESEARAAARAAAVNAAMVEEVQRAHATQMAFVVADRDRANARAKRAAEMLKEVYRAKDSENGPVAPVLRRTLGQLR